MSEDEKRIHVDIDSDYYELVFGEGKIVNDKSEYAHDQKKDIGRIKSALEKAHEIRQFEMVLYWRRSIYFWGFMIALFTGYGVLMGEISGSTIKEVSGGAIKEVSGGAIKEVSGSATKEVSGSATKEVSGNTLIPSIIALALSVLGLFISFAWYYLEKGSKAYPRNWEFHIDYLEGPITGHLHKTLIGDRGDYFSVSRINRSIIKAIGLFWLVASPISIYVLLDKNLNFSNLGKLCGPICVIVLLFLAIYFTVKYFSEYWKRTLPQKEKMFVTNQLKEKIEVIQRMTPERIKPKKK